MLAATHRQAAALAATLATRLRLPHSKPNKAQPTDGDLPVA